MPDARGPTSSADGPLAALPFDALRARLERLADAALARPEALREPLAALGALADPEPLAHLFAALAARDAFDPPEAPAAQARADLLVEALGAHSNVALWLALRTSAAGLRATVARALAALAPALPLARSEGYGVLDRALRRGAPALHRALEEHAENALRAALEAGPDAVRALDDATLRALSGRALAALDEPARALLAPRYARFASALLALLAARAPALAQVRARALLAREVYGDPTHFVLELVQNADDAGARALALALDDERGALVVTHDGAPLDARDALALASLGASTKGAGQIGTFGVGFQSVFQCSERPRLRCGPWHFELSAAGALRPLASDDARALDASCTELTLPLRPELDRAALDRALRALPAELLLTLPNLRALRYARASSGLAPRALRASPPRADAPDAPRTLYDGDAPLRSFLCARAGATLVALPVDARAAPTPLAADEPALYAFLPTAERTGLRALVHAPFALSVDRERVALAHPTNAPLLLDAAPALAALAEALPHERRAALLEVLPLRDELRDAARALAPALAGALASVALVPRYDGTLAPAPSLALVEPRALAPALVGAPLGAGPDGAPRAPAAAALAGRAARLARELGAVELGPDALAALVADALRAVPDGAPASAAAPWVLATLAALPTLAPDAARPFERALRALPCVLVDGALHPPSRSARAAAPFAPLLARLRPTLDDDALAPPLRAHLERLGVDLARADELAALLRDERPRAALLDAPGADDAPLLRALDALPAPLLASLDATPLLRDRSGVRRAARALFAPPPADDSLAPLLAVWSGPLPPLLDAPLAAAHPALLRALRVAPLELPAFALFLCEPERARALDRGSLRALHEALARAPRALDAALRERLARAPLYRDREGAPRPLVGEGAARLASDDAAGDALRALWPHAPWLDDALAALPHVRALAAPASALDASALARALALPDERRDAAGFPAPRPPHEALATYLAAHAQRLDPGARAALCEAPLWLARDGSRWPLAALRRAPSSAALRAHLEATEPSARWLDEAPERPETSLFAALGAPLAAPPEGPAAHLATLAPELVYSRGAAYAAALRALALAALDEAPDAPSRRALARALAPLPLCEAPDGALAPAAALLDPDEARRVLGDALFEALARPLAPLLRRPLAARERDARALAALLPAAPSRPWLAALVEREARAGAPLGDAPSWLRTEDLAAAALEALHRGDEAPEELGPWPLAVTAARTLAAPPLAAPRDDDERAIALAFGLAPALAHPAFAAALAHPARFVTALAPRALLRALHARGGAALRDPALRAALYRWLSAHGPALLDEPEDRALLARAPLVADARGEVRPASELTYDPRLLALGLGDAPEPAVPAALCAWLARHFATERGALERVARGALAAHARAVEARDHARAHALLGALARAFPWEQPERLAALVEALPRDAKLHRGLLAPARDGSLHRPRALLHHGTERDDDDALLERFCASPPPRLGPPAADDPPSVALLRACGLAASLDTPALAALLDGRGLAPGPAAPLALARYVAARLVHDGSLREHLALDRRAWLPTATGALAAPRELHWPTHALARLGAEPPPAQRPHETLALTAPAGFAERLAFRSVDELAPALVLDAVAAGRGALPAQRAFVERALREGSLSAPALRAHRSAPLLREAARPDEHPRLCAALDAREPPTRARSDDATPAAEAPAPEAPSAEQPAPEAPAPEAPAARPWHQRVRGWFRTNEASAPAAPTAPPREAPEPTDTQNRKSINTNKHIIPSNHDRFFRPTRAVEPQTEGRSGWLDERRVPARYALAHVPRALAPPYAYAPHTVADRFDPSTQRWEHAHADPAWLEGDALTGARVALRGVLPPGASVLPLPTYGALVASSLRAEGALERDPLGRTLVLDERDDPAPRPLEYAAELRAVPSFDPRERDARGLGPAALYAPTAPDHELPDEAHRFVAALALRPAPALERALEVRAFVRARYRYDPSYLEDPAVARWLHGLAAGHAHAHLAALHAGRDATHLGRGVCYELNALVVELLRRAGIAAAVCTGWVFDHGELSEPDHLWALALLPTAAGPRWLPLDAAATAEGRPLRVPRRAAANLRPPPQPPMPPGGLPQPPPWLLDARPRERPPERRAAAPRRAPEPRAPANPPHDALAAVARWLAQRAGAPAQSALDAAVREALERAERSPDEAARLLRALGLEAPDAPDATDRPRR